MTGVDITDAFVDKGYRGHDYEGDATVHISGSSKKKLTRTQKKRRAPAQRGGTEDWSFEE